MLLIACKGDESFEETCSQDSYNTKAGLGGALLASRINSLEALKEIVKIQYYSADKLSIPGRKENDKVVLTYCNQGTKVNAILSDGIKQGDILKAKEGDWVQKIELCINSPYSVYNYKKLKNIYLLSRRRYDLFGRKDVAFYDLAESSVERIRNRSMSFVENNDSSELGYINTFNHITAQAIITILYSKKIAKFIADVHEREAMGELINGRFTVGQLRHSTKNPIDNYVDIINNSCGQMLGEKLKKKYKIKDHTIWTELLLTNVLNDIQLYYSTSFNISFVPFNEEEEIIFEFTRKLNYLPNS